MEGKHTEEPSQIDYSQTDPLSALGYSAQPGDIYYINPPRELSTYPMYIDNPKEMDKKPLGKYISYSMDGTDISERLFRRYSEFYSLYEKLLARWPGIYIPKIPPKIVIKTTSPKTIRTRMRLLNKFCLNLSKISYLYNSEETTIFKSNIQEVSNALKKLPELTYGEILSKMKEALPGIGETYDILLGLPKIQQFDSFLKNTYKNFEKILKIAESATELRENEKQKFIELVNGFKYREKTSILPFADNNESSLIFYNPTYTSLTEKIDRLNQQIINPFNSFKEWVEEEMLDTDAMITAIKQINDLLTTQKNLRAKSDSLEIGIKKIESGNVNPIVSLFKKPDKQKFSKEKDKENTDIKIMDLEQIIKIVGENMESQIDSFRKQKQESYYKILKLFAILQRESNRVIRELWTLVREALNDIAPNIKERQNDFVSKPFLKLFNNTQQFPAPNETEVKGEEGITYNNDIKESNDGYNFSGGVQEENKEEKLDENEEKKIIANTDTNVGNSFSGGDNNPVPEKQQENTPSIQQNQSEQKVEAPAEQPTQTQETEKTEEKIEDSLPKQAQE